MEKIYKVFIITLLLSLPFAISAQKYVAESVLASGKWYKLGVTDNGLYKLTYQDLIDMGVDIQSLNPKKIGLYGNVAGMLPEKNSDENYDDLSEIDIIVEGENDGKFDENDLIIFYGQSPVKWIYESNLYKYKCNYYTDTTYYFLRTDCENDGARISEQTNIQGYTNRIITSFQDCQYHDLDMHNYFKQGRRWYGEEISGETTKKMSFPFTFKNAITDKQAHVSFTLVGSSKSEVLYASLYANGRKLFDDIRVPKATDHVFGYEIANTAYFDMNNDIANIEVEIVSENAASMIGVDIISLNAWRKLRYENEDLAFGIVAEQFDSQPNQVIIENVNSDMLLFDVLDPIHPVIQQFNYNSSFLLFNVIPDSFKSYLLTEKANLRSVSSVQNIDNQNLHAISNADMLIITHPLFKEQAYELADFHLDYDGLNCLVIDINQIRNEFASGSNDVTGLRNFIRMVYNRTNDLRYVLLFGDGTSDYKDVLGYGNNFIPSYQAYETYKELGSFVCDDYFVLMDPVEGDNCYGTLDINIGRLPVSSVYEANIAIDKIKHYTEKSYDVYGSWRSNFLFVSDDDSKEYPKNCESFIKVFDTDYRNININKVYEDAYVRQKVTNGYIYPEASLDLVSKLEEGQLLMTYVGHGGIKGLTKEHLFDESHINALNNYDRLVFVVTGTCEFSKFDNPSYQSAGEQLFLNPHGGAIAMFTTTRPTQSGSNVAIIRKFYESLAKDDGIRNKSFGEIVTDAKNGSSANLYYTFFGDPALRFSYPERDVKITEINSQTNDYQCVVGAMGKLNIKGEISDAAGNADTCFNGYIYPKLYDNMSDYQILNNVGTAYNTFDFKIFDDVLYEGKITVRNGRFDFDIYIPRSTNYQNNNARLSCYAIDTVRMIDANGSNEDIRIQGVDNEAVVNTQGPEIRMSWNGIETDDAISEQDGELKIFVNDPQGLYHYDATVGRNIMLAHNAQNINEIVSINKYFEPAVDDITKGSMTLNYSGLEIGEHYFTIHLWDLHDNSSEKTIHVTVKNTLQTHPLENVVNYPNPFNESTNFSFSYSENNVKFNIIIDIYDVVGRQVVSLLYYNLDSKSKSVSWNGCDASGNHLPSGVYLYRLRIEDENGNEYMTNQRMVVN